MLKKLLALKKWLLLYSPDQPGDMCNQTVQKVNEIMEEPGGLDWRKWSEEKPEEGRMIIAWVTDTGAAAIEYNGCSYIGIFATKQGHRAYYEMGSITHWAYFNEPE